MQPNKPSFKRIAYSLVLGLGAQILSMTLNAGSASALPLRADAQAVDAEISSVATRLQLYQWRTHSDKPRGVVIAVHGTTQQAGCFDKMAKTLNGYGFHVLGMDLRGHGRWYFRYDQSNPRHTVSYTRSAQDLANVASHLRSACPKLPIFCIGESVGAAVAVRAASGRPDLFDGIVMASAGTSPHVFSPMMIARDFTRGITDLSRPLDVREYITKYSSEDPRITKEMCTDPLSRTMLTGKEILQTGAFIRKTPHFARMITPNISVLILQGEDDQIVKPSTLAPVLENLQSTDKTMVSIPNCGHLLLGTAFLKPAVMSPLCDWLVKQTDSRETAAVALPGRSP